MPDEPIPADMGFAEFVSKLIEETFEAVSRSLAEQDQRRAELRTTASLTLDEFARRTVADADAEAFLASEFPPKGGRRGRAAATKLPYTPPSDGIDESPPFARRLGVTLTKKHYKVARAGAVLTPAGAKLVREAARAALARDRYESLRRAVAQGLPNVVVDHGKIHARLAFRAVRTEDAAKPQFKKRLLTPLKPLGQLGAPLRASASDLRSVRLLVSQANIAAQTTGQTIDVLGDVEITFKTVT